MAKNVICRAAVELMPAGAEHTAWHLQGVLTRKKSTSEVSFVFSDEGNHRIRITMDFLFRNNQISGHEMESGFIK